MNRPVSEHHQSGIGSFVTMRMRITLWVLAILAVVFVSLSLIHVLFQRQRIQAEIEDAITESAARLVRPSSVPGTAQSLPVARLGGHHRVIMCHPDGTPWSSSGFGPSGDPDGFAAGVLSRAHQHDPQQPAMMEIDGFIVGYIRGPDGRIAMVAVPAERISAELAPVVTDLAVSFLISLLSCGIATWFMSGIAVRPLLQVQAFAEEMSAETVAEGLEFDATDTSPEIESLRNELDAAMARLGDGYDRQARFLANVSHELKTPISVIRTEAEVLLAGEAPRDDLKDFARSASEEMHRLGRMIESFLLLTRIRHGSAQIQARRHNPNDLLMDTLDQSHAMAEQYGVKLDLTLHDGPEAAEVEGNEDLLQTAIGNLIRNAIRFSPKNGHVEINCRATGEHVEFRIRDFGPGVPPELLGRLFEPFTQADEERQRGRGTGLGLQIAQGIAELHGGHIGVANLDVGCRFTLSVPNKVCTADPAART